MRLCDLFQGVPYVEVTLALVDLEQNSRLSVANLRGKTNNNTQKKIVN
jgi:hypothetical protein